MEINRVNLDGIVVVELKEELDLFHSSKLRSYFSTLFEESSKKIILNFQHVTYIDSSGIGVLLHIFKQSKEKQVRTLFTNINGSVKKVIELTKLNDYFPIFPTQEDAVEKLNTME